MLFLKDHNITTHYNITDIVKDTKYCILYEQLIELDKTFLMLRLIKFKFKAKRRMCAKMSDISLRN